MSFDVRRIVSGGLVAGAAYLGAQIIDLKVAGNRLDDTVLLARLTPAPDRLVRPTGLAMHLGNSIVASVAYHVLARDRLPGPGWLRGVAFALTENVALYPLAALERLHPAIRAGELDSYRTPTAFAQQAWRHLAFGAALGAVSGTRDR